MENLFQTTDAPQPGDQTLGDDFFDGQQEAQGKDDGLDLGIQEQEAQREAQRQQEGRIDIDPETDETGVESEDDLMNLDLDGDEDEYLVPPAEDQDDEEEEEQEESQDDIDLARLNKELGTDYKSLKELKEAFKGDKEQEQQAQVVSEEEEKQYEKNANALNYLENFLQYNDEQTIREKKIADRMQEKNGEKLTEDEIEEIDFEIQRYKDNGTDAIIAQNIRNTVEKQVDKLKGFNKAIDEKKESAKQKDIAARRQELQSSFSDIYNGKNFYGVEPTPEDIKESYKSVTSGSFYEKVQNDPNLTAELALMLQLRDKIKETASAPKYSDGVKRVMDEIEGKDRSKSNRIKTSRVSAKNQRGNLGFSGDALVNAFVQ